MNKTTITFWSGLRTIGGNIAEITFGNNRVIFDFGLVYDPASLIVNADHTREKSKYITDLLKLAMIPNMDGVYSNKDLSAGEPFFNKKPVPYEKSKMTTAVLISHLHLDHMGAIDTLAPSVPVYMSAESKKLYDTLINIGEGLTFSREVLSFQFAEKLQIGAISVTPYRIDHDIIGAASFLIETPDLKILYSGDFRLHGLHPEYFHHLIKSISQQQIDILLIEGTTIKPTKEENTDTLCQTETDIIQVSKHLLSEYKGLAFFNLYHRNIERLHHILQVATLTNRTAVLELETAYLANTFLENPSFLIYDNKIKKTDWNKKLLMKYARITPAEMNVRPGNYFVQNRFENILNLLDFDLKESVYIHTNGTPLGNFDPDYPKLLSVLNHLDIDYKPLHVSGHALEKDILTYIEQVRPKIVIPWHSQYPELIKPISPNQTVFYPKEKVTYVYEENHLKQI
ncbi:MBL fold metallo-hydrolase [Siminovitchia sp. FSL H7-0308]|uniref:Ribonuclease J n=1 Tax=Siminovitchia thermophila TaxID=1245522 RepID=A0ABS2RDG6_9BACI|nr:MBL fold metallo-hydrolase [Siminovitchia thermophila]MBM7717219.1 ribonuclease J [Siminovitchia thermophila]ONK23011.1 hypothetical protein BLX87_13040 [Bacillus sp. VT-16-64]